VMKRSRLYPRPMVVSGSVSAVGQAGGVLLTETIRAAGLDARRRGLPLARHPRRSPPDSATRRHPKPLASRPGCPGCDVADLSSSYYPPPERESPQKDPSQMGIYRVLWRRVVCALTLLGTAHAVLVLPAGVLLGVLACAAIVGSTVTVWLHFRTRGAAPPLTALLTAGTLTTLGALAATGLLALVGIPVLLGAVLLIACSPPVLGHLPVRQVPAAQADPQTAGPPAAGSAAVLPRAEYRRAVLAVAHQPRRPPAHRVPRPVALPDRNPIRVPRRARPPRPRRIHPLATQRRRRRQRPGTLSHPQRFPSKPPPRPLSVGSHAPSQLADPFDRNVTRVGVSVR